MSQRASRLIGVLGGGQLGRMLALAGTPLGFDFRFLDPDPACPAAPLGELVVGAFDDPQALDRLAEDAEVVTFEFENVPVASLRHVAERAPIAPGAESLATAQDRVLEKRFFESCGVPVQPWAAVDDAASLDAALARIGAPCVLKTRRLGYDGKGQCVIRRASDARSAFESLGGAPCLLEAFVSFSRELSVVGVRARDGSTAVWPISENVHRDGILHTTVAPAEVSASMRALLEGAVERVMIRLDHVGVLTIEFFDDHGALFANEMAPRVHNSGHWTIDGAVTSQFENHLRAIRGLPFGSTDARGHAAMLNLIGTHPRIDDLAAEADLKIHLYGKAHRPGRKVGHVTVVASTAHAVRARLRELEARFAPVPGPAAGGTRVPRR